MTVHRVLVVDDNHEIRRMVTASIKTLGAEIDVLDVPSAEEALFISATLPLDLVVLDFRLPGMSGLEMVNWLRNRLPETKIILVTGVEDAATRQQISEAGVAAYFFKPIEIATFLDAVRHCLWSQLAVTSKPAAVAALPGEPAAGEVKPADVRKVESKLDERLTALKVQVRATSVLLVNETGQILEVAGNPSHLTNGSTLLPALIDAFRASQRVSDVLGGDSVGCLHYFTDAEQRIYLAPVDASTALLLITGLYSEPEKLGMLDRAIDQAVRDIGHILQRMHEEEGLQPVVAGIEHVDMPVEVIVDPETLAGVANIFSHAPKGGVREAAEGFWETLEENSQLGGASSKDVISYDQARDMGLAPADDRQS
jgi:DNA-binding response OmpR family regulator